jgi:PKD repeat protein
LTQNIYTLFRTCLVLIICISIGRSQTNVDFRATSITGCGLVQTVFKDSTTTSSPITGYLWDLGGVTSEKASPGRVFDKPGKYRVCLTVTTADGNKTTKCKDNFIEVFAKPEANFSLDKNQGCSPVLVNFKDLSKSDNGKITEWIWDIGGSSNVLTFNTLPSVIQSTYTSGGNYTLSLTIKDEKGCIASTVKKDVLKIQKIANPILTKKYLESCSLPWKVEIKNNNIDANAQYTWNFGNNTVHNGPTPPAILFNALGNYNLTLIAKKGICSDTTFIKDFVTTSPRKVIIPDNTTICEGSTIKFKEDAEVAADSIRWVFHNGFTTNEKTPSFTYNIQGCYKVKLLRFSSTCKDSVTYDCIKVNKAAVPQMSIQNQFKCTVPIDITGSSTSSGGLEWTLSGNAMNITKSGNNAKFTIANYGTYQLKLKYTDPQGCAAEATRNVDIKKFDVNLPFAFVGGCAPYEVQLADSIFSETPITSYEWIVGPNGNIHKSKVKSPKFILDAPGSHDVTLIATNNLGCIDTTIRAGYVQGGVKPTVDFTVTPADTCQNVERIFNALTSANATKWEWDFGDESYAMDKSVKHTYGQPKKYNVTLTASDRGCFNSVRKDNVVSVNFPLSRFYVKHNCDTIEQINLTKDPEGADSLYWIVDYKNRVDTIRDTLLNKLTFPDRGIYFVTMYTKNFQSGCENLRTDSIFITKPIASYTTDTLQGCSPLTVNFTSTSQDAMTYKYVRQPGDTLTTNNIVITQPGTYNVPSILAIDRNGCRDSISYNQKIKVNKVFAIPDFQKSLCIPADLQLSSKSLDSFSTITNVAWMIDTVSILGDSIKYFLANPAVYNLRLSVKDAWGCTDSIELKEAIEAIELKADFTVDSLGCTNQDLLFLPKGDGVNTATYIWELGDKTIDSSQVVRKRYNQEGSYNICLTLQDRRGCESKICKDSVINIKNPKAEFFGDKLSETCPPLLTNFTNLSTNAISYQWDFGDNSGLSFVEKPSHVYLDPDTFDVMLIAIRSETCRDTFVRKDYITLLGPVGKVEYKILGNCTPLQIEFTATSDKLYNYIWDFGNGIIDSSSTITDNEVLMHAYGNAGKYDPKLLITDNFGCRRNFSMPTIEVNVLNANFNALDSTLCEDKNELVLKNSTISTATSNFYNWLIIQNNDTIQSSEDSISTFINKLGYHQITLIGETTNCKDTLTKSKYILLGANPDLATKVDSLICIGSTINLSDISTTKSGAIDSVFWKIENKSIEGKDINYKFLQSGLYDITHTAVTDEGCLNEQQIQLEVKSADIIDLGNDTLLCQGQSIKLTNKRNPDLLLQWKQDEIDKCKDCKEYEFYPLDTAFIAVTYKNTNGCISDDNLKIILAPEPVPSAELGEDTTMCLNAFVTIKILNYNPSHKYEWPQFPSTSCLLGCEGISFKAIQPLKIVNKVTNKYGCSSLDSLSLSIESSIPDFLPNEKSICDGKELSLSIDSSIDPLYWTLNKDTICRNCDSVKVKPLKNEVYTLTVKSQNQCIYKDSVMVNIIKLNSIDAGKDFEICKGEEIKSTGKGVGSGIWFTIDSTINNSNNLSTFPQKTQKYYLEYTKDECTLRDSMNVVVLDKVKIKAVGDTLCYGETLYLKASGDAFKYEWLDKSGKLISLLQSDSLLAEKSLDVVLVGKRTTCVSDTLNIVYKVHPKIDYTVKDDEIKVYYNTKHFVSTSYDPARNYSYQWFPDYALSCKDCPEPIISNLLQTELFQVIVTDEDTKCETEVFFNADLTKECSEKAFIIPNVIKPETDNAAFELKHGFINDFNYIKILDRWGNMVYTSNDLNFKWDGTNAGKALSPGVYVYVISATCVQKNNEEYHFGGDVLLLK